LTRRLLLTPPERSLNPIVLRTLLEDPAAAIEEIATVVAKLDEASQRALLATLRVAAPALDDGTRQRLAALEAVVAAIAAPETRLAPRSNGSPRGAADDGRTRLRSAAGPTATAIVDRDAANRTRTRDRTESPANSVTPVAGMVLQDRYRLDELVGQGAMGQVWRARDLLSEEAGEHAAAVAIKLFTADFEHDPSALALMQREASRAQRLAHPNIATVHVFDRDRRTGLLYMAMEFVDGQTLDAVLRDAGRHGLGRRAAMPLILGIAEGLAYAHRSGIVHCDLNPGSVIVSHGGVAKILDFGIAQGAPTAARSERPGAGHTEDEPLITGYTAAYASPETLAGERVDPRDDVFALGLVAYEIVSGERPFGERTSLEARQLGLVPKRPRELKAHEWRAIRRAITLIRARRYDNAGQFRKALVGTSRLQRGLAGATMALVLVAGALGYRNYRASLPAMAFEELPPADQAQVRDGLAQGREALAYEQQTHDPRGLQDAAEGFDRAYMHHPRNREATAGLTTTAALAIEFATTARNRAEALEFLRTLQQHTPESRFFETYAPMNAAIERLAH
jgi:hypothetical protein